MENEKLFSAFPPVETGKWKQAIEKLLEGKDYKETLEWKTKEGVDLEPFYRIKQEDYDATHLLVGKSHPPGWQSGYNVDEEINIPNQLKLAVKHGAQAVRLGWDAFENIDPDLVKKELKAFEVLQLDFKAVSSNSLKLLREKLGKIEFSEENTLLLLGYEPLKSFLTTGKWQKNREEDLQSLWDVFKGNAKNEKIIRIDGAFFQNAGATIVQELAFTLAVANEFFERYSEITSLKELQRAFYFNLCIGPNFHLELSKFRAFRVLWKNFLNAYGLAEQEPVLLSGETATWNKSIADPYNNLLRLTSEMTAGALGGANIVFSTPFNHAFKKPDEFSQRLSLNLQLMLKHESLMDLTTDLAGGSHYYESLTYKLGEKAWWLFQKIQEEGGILAFAESGKLRDSILKERHIKINEFNKSKLVLIGINKYPNKQEKLAFALETKNNFSSGEMEMVPIRPFRVSEKLENERITDQEKTKEA